MLKEVKTKDLEIRGFIETSFLDWDGHVVSSVYVPRCNFRCPFCHNFDLIENPQQHDIVPIEKIESFIRERKNFIDGVCLTGGEPCVYKDSGLFGFASRIKALGVKLKLDTNGTDPDTIKKLIDEKLVDYIAMDVKGPLDQRYDRLSGVKTDIDKIKKSIDIIMKSGVSYEFRTTVVPTLMSAENVTDIAKGISGAWKFVLQQFVPANTWDKSLRDIKPYEKKELEAMRLSASAFVKKCVIRGA